MTSNQAENMHIAYYQVSNTGYIRPIVIDHNKLDQEIKRLWLEANGVEIDLSWHEEMGFCVLSAMDAMANVMRILNKAYDGSEFNPQTNRDNYCLIDPGELPFIYNTKTQTGRPIPEFTEPAEDGYPLLEGMFTPAFVHQWYKERQDPDEYLMSDGSGGGSILWIP